MISARGRKLLEKRPDAIVVGAGQNGLVRARYLGRVRLRVLVQEAYQQLSAMKLTLAERSRGIE